MLSTHTHTNKERKSRGDFYVVTLQMVLKKEKEEKKKKKEKKNDLQTCSAAGKKLGKGDSAEFDEESSSCS